MADILRAARGKLRKLVDPGAKDSAPASDANEGQQAALEAELETYKHAFETTSEDRDRLAAEVETYKHAFETTSEDRDQIARLLAKHEALSGHQYFPLPNLFCLGAPKCATSTVYSLLRNLDEVFLTPKDLNYLGVSNFDIRRYMDKTAAILRERNAFYGGEKVIGEFFVSAYTDLSYASAVKRIFGDDVKILFCLRDPVQRIISEYRMRLHALRGSTRRGNLRFTEEADLVDAIARERASDKKVQDLPYDAFKQTTMYISSSLYFRHLRQYFDIFGGSNIHVILYENDIKHDMFKTLQELTSFLTLDCDAQTLTRVCNDTQKFTDISRAPDDFEIHVTLPNGVVIVDADTIAEDHDPIARIEVRRVSADDRPAIVLDAPTPRLVTAALRLRDRHRQTLDLEARRDLYYGEFADDVSRLEDLLGRDLSIWYKEYE